MEEVKAMLSEALSQYMVEKGLRPSDLSVGTNAPHLSSVSRVLRSVTRDPRISTLIHVCRLIDVDPTQVLTRAGMWPTSTSGGGSARSAEEGDRLQATYRRCAALPDDLRGVVTSQVETLLHSLEALARSRANKLPARGRSPE